MRTRQEEILSALCHLFNAVPLWGLLFCGWIWFSVREESRVVVTQARQAMIFHVLLMAGLLVWLLLGLLSRVVWALSPTLGGLLDNLNLLILALLLVAYVAVCLYGFARRLSGLPFAYPLLGNRP